uniref:Sulfotransferase n=1 Tax=Sander lucioperca TaxID=283035 RepID=A0A8D0D9T8_SANLU
TERLTSIPIYNRVPMLEAAFPSLQPGKDHLDNLTISPRLIKTHFPQKSKIVYMARNAKDSVVSYFNMEHMTTLHPEPGDWSSYLQRFMEGKMVFGSWHDHVNGWWEKKQNKLCCFLGLSPSAEEKEIIIGKVQFDAMKKNNMVNYSTSRELDFTKSSFMRKGKVDDWKNHFTVAQDEKFDENYKQKMKNSTLQFHTEV